MHPMPLPGKRIVKVFVSLLRTFQEPKHCNVTTRKGVKAPYPTQFSDGGWKRRSDDMRLIFQFSLQPQNVNQIYRFRQWFSGYPARI